MYNTYNIGKTEKYYGTTVIPNTGVQGDSLKTIQIGTSNFTIPNGVSPRLLWTGEWDGKTPNTIPNISQYAQLMLELKSGEDTCVVLANRQATTVNDGKDFSNSFLALPATVFSQSSTPQQSNGKTIIPINGDSVSAVTSIFEVIDSSGTNQLILQSGFYLLEPAVALNIYGVVSLVDITEGKSFITKDDVIQRNSEISTPDLGSPDFCEKTDGLFYKKSNSITDSFGNVDSGAFSGVSGNIVEGSSYSAYCQDNIYIFQRNSSLDAIVYNVNTKTRQTLTGILPEGSMNISGAVGYNNCVYVKLTLDGITKLVEYNTQTKQTSVVSEQFHSTGNSKGLFLFNDKICSISSSYSNGTLYIYDAILGNTTTQSFTREGQYALPGDFVITPCMGNIYMFASAYTEGADKGRMWKLDCSTYVCSYIGDNTTLNIPNTYSDSLLPYIVGYNEYIYMLGGGHINTSGTSVTAVSGYKYNVELNTLQTLSTSTKIGPVCCYNTDNGLTVYLCGGAYTGSSPYYGLDSFTIVGTSFSLEKLVENKDLQNIPVGWSLMAADKADSVVIEVGSYMYYITVLQPDGEFYFGGLLPAPFLEAPTVQCFAQTVGFDIPEASYVHRNITAYVDGSTKKVKVYEKTADSVTEITSQCYVYIWVQPANF